MISSQCYVKMSKASFQNMKKLSYVINSNTISSRIEACEKLPGAYVLQIGVVMGYDSSGHFTAQLGPLIF